MEKAETETQAPGRERTARRDGGESETETGGEGWGRVWEHPDGRGEGRTDRRKLRSLGLEPGTLWLCGATQGSCHGQQWELGGLGAQEPLLAFHTTGRSLQWPGACVTCPLRRAQPARGPLSLSSLLPCPFLPFPPLPPFPSPPSPPFPSPPLPPFLPSLPSFRPSFLSFLEEGVGRAEEGRERES